MTHRIGPRPHTATTPTVTATHPTPCYGPNASWWDDQIDRPGSGESPNARAARHRKAIEVCNTCPLMAACLEDRLHGGDKRGGVHGGRVFAEGSAQPESVPTTSWALSKPPGLPRCQNIQCGTELTVEQQRHGARSCSYRCQRAAENARRRERRAAHRGVAA